MNILKKDFMENTIWCIENNQTNKLYKYIKEGINMELVNL